MSAAGPPQSANSAPVGAAKQRSCERGGSYKRVRSLLESAAMIDHVERIRGHFADSAQLKQEAADAMAESIASAGALMTECLFADGKILTCGNGGSASDAQHFAAELVGRFARERRALAAISLTTDTSILTSVANDYAYERVFARQVEALGRAGDVAVGISTSGASANVLAGLR